MTEVADQILVLRFQGGDEAAFERLFERHNGPLKYYLRRMLGSRELADDAAQTTWLKALRGIRGLRRLDAFRTWLYTVARHEALRQLGAKRREFELDANEAAVENLASEEKEFTVEDAALLNAAMERIGPTHREVLVLRYVEGMTYEEVAAVVGCPLGTVRSRIHNAKSAVRAILKEKDDVRR